MRSNWDGIHFNSYATDQAHARTIMQMLVTNGNRIINVDESRDHYDRIVIEYRSRVYD